MPPDIKHTILLHLLSVFDFIGLTETQPFYLAFLKAQFALDAVEENSPARAELETQRNRAKKRFEIKYAEEVKNLEELIYKNKLYIGRFTSADDNYTLFSGANKKHLESLIRQDGELEHFPTNQVIIENHIETSLFSDGTILQRQKPLPIDIQINSSSTVRRKFPYHPNANG